jgi:hypothetical protein
MPRRDMELPARKAGLPIAPVSPGVKIHNKNFHPGGCGLQINTIKSVEILRTKFVTGIILSGIPP